tara:strand:+ start:793 stop:1056 length:264 start_codon:yes stop_codon:yes gene_type:complete
MDMKSLIKQQFQEIYAEMLVERRKAPSSGGGRSNFGTRPELEWQVKNRYYGMLKDIVKDGKAFGVDFGELGEAIKATPLSEEPGNFE